MIVEYNFQEFTSKDMFEIKLKDTIPDFGYIACTKRKPFYEFCIKHGFFDRLSSLTPKRTVWLQEVLVEFRFSGMIGYRPQIMVFAAGSKAVVNSSFKMHNT